MGKWEILPKKIINHQFLGSNTSKVKPYNRQKPTKKINLLRLVFPASDRFFTLLFQGFSEEFTDPWPGPCNLS